MNEIKPTFASSVDPSQISLTVSSIFKAAIFFVGYFAAAKGFDVTTATTQVEAIRDIVLTSIPAGFALFHAITAVWGLVRKVLVVKAV